MSKRAKGTLLLTLGIICLIGATFALVSGIAGLVSSFKTIATVEGPGSTDFTISEAGRYTIWHEHKGIYNGKSVNYPKHLPTGFSFKVYNNQGEAFSPHPSSGGTMTTGNVERASVGTVTLPELGTYSLNIEGPAQNRRVFVVTKGALMGTLSTFFVEFGVGGFLALLGLPVTIIGLVMLFSKTKKTPPPLPGS